MAIVGIDLGTTNSLVALMGDDGPRTLPNELGDHLTPSAVAVAEDGAVLVGRAAKDRLVIAPESGRAFFKRDIGTKTVYRFGGREWSPTECSARVLAELARIAAMHLGSPVQRAVISVPAYFHDSQRQATMEAATIAGLRVERLINEPTAAALAFGYRERQGEGRILVFDLGGGTFDVTILDRFEGVIEVKASGGESRLGGEDFTDLLLDHLLGTDVARIDAAQRARLRQAAEVAKRQLATQAQAEVSIGAERRVVTQADFVRITQPLMDQIRPVVRRCLRDAGLEPKDLAEVLLVGGASRMPMIGEYIRRELHAFGNRSMDPDRVVALGAAVQAALCDRQEAVEDLVLTDVTPHTLGVVVAKQFSTREIESGYFSPIIDRNTTVPVSRVSRYTALSWQQDSITLKIYQGENRSTQDNTLLGTMQITGLRQKPGQPPADVDVRFTYDMNGILEVDVTIVPTGQRLTHVIQSRPGQLTREQIAAAIRRMQPLKLHPRDSLPHRARLERGRRLFRELTGAVREALSARLDDFERALESQDPGQIAQAAAVLDSFLAPFYADEGEQRPPPGGRDGA